MSWFDTDGVLHEADDDDEEQDEIVHQMSDDNGQLDYVPIFPPDFDLSEEGILDISVEKIYPDLFAFQESQRENLKIFLKARQEHGNHLDNPEWYDRAGLAIKCWRYIKAYQEGEIPTSEELSDLSNYSTMILSRNKSVDELIQEGNMVQVKKFVEKIDKEIMGRENNDDTI